MYLEVHLGTDGIWLLVYRTLESVLQFAVKLICLNIRSVCPLAVQICTSIYSNNSTDNKISYMDMLSLTVSILNSKIIYFHRNYFLALVLS